MNAETLLVALQLFGATFITVFALGVQSLNVNGGHKALAAITSLAIGASNLVLLKILPGPTTWAHHIGYFAGGIVGILCAMQYHPTLAGLIKRKQPPTRGQADAALAAATTPAHQPQQGMQLEPTLPTGRPSFPLLVALAQALLDAEQFGHAATPEMRRRACMALGRLQSVPATAAK